MDVFIKSGQKREINRILLRLVFGTYTYIICFALCHILCIALNFQLLVRIFYTKKSDLEDTLYVSMKY